MNVSTSTARPTERPANAESVQAELRRMLCDILLLKPSEVAADALLVDDLGLDSLGFIDLTFAVEERFAVEFPDVKSNLKLLGEPIPVALRAIEAVPGAATLFEFMKACACEQEFDGQNAEELATAVCGRVPRGVDPEAPLAALPLSILLRFVTVRTMVRYVEHLIAAAAADTAREVTRR